jgi:short-subunit dehydrogenase
MAEHLTCHFSFFITSFWYMTNKYALITGASTGIGEALMHEFAQDGYNIIAVANNEGELGKTIERHQAMHKNIRIIPFEKDLAEEFAAEELFDELKAQNINVEVLVNDAGQGQLGEFSTISIERDIELIRLNIESVVRLTKLFLPNMHERNSGKILNLGSIAGFQPGPKLAVYHATKAFVVSFSEALAEEKTQE